MFQQILVATDLTPTSDTAVSIALEMARAQEAQLFIVHVVELPRVLKVWKQRKKVVDLRQYRLIVTRPLGKHDLHGHGCQGDQARHPAKASQSWPPRRSVAKRSN